MVLLKFVHQLKQTLIVLVRLSFHSLLYVLVRKLNIRENFGIFLFSKGTTQFFL
jgi:hypothetical protein